MKNGCIAFILRRIFKAKFLGLIAAIRHGNLNLVKSYHVNKVNFNNYLENGDTPLHVAVRANRLEIVKFICENIVNINVNDRNFIGDTPLLTAVMNSNFEIVKYLTAIQNADGNVPENRGYTPFIAACANGNVDVVKFLASKIGVDFKLKAYDGQTGLHRAAFYGNYEVIVYLVKHLKMNVLVPDKKGNLPLHLACMKVNITCSRLLLKASSKSAEESMHTKNKFGVSPLEILVKQFNRLREPNESTEYTLEEMQKYLEDKGNQPQAYKILLMMNARISKPRERRFSAIEHATDIKNKLRGFLWNKNLVFGPNGSPLTVEPETNTNLKQILSDGDHEHEELDDFNVNALYEPTKQDDYKVTTDENAFPLSEENRLSILSSRMMTTTPRNPLPKSKTIKTGPKSGLFMSKLSSIKNGDDRSPVSAITNDLNMFTPSATATADNTDLEKVIRLRSTTNARISPEVSPFNSPFTSPDTSPKKSKTHQPLLRTAFSTRTRSKFAFEQ